MMGVYREIVEPDRLVFTSAALDEKGNPLFEVLTTVTFAEHSGKTKLTLRASVAKATPAAAPHLKGMEQDWSQSLDRLAKRGFSQLSFFSSTNTCCLRFSESMPSMSSISILLALTLRAFARLRTCDTIFFGKLMLCRTVLLLAAISLKNCVN